MRAVLIIASNAFREIIRDRILYGIVVFALFLIGISLALGELSFTEQARISANFGFAGIQLGAAILSIFIGSTLVAREIEKQTILTLLARPISRAQFLVGKFLGLVLVILTVMAGLALVLTTVVSLLKLPITAVFLIALYGVLLEAVILISVALFFGSFSRPIMTVMFTFSVFGIGHWISSLEYFIEKSPPGTFKTLGGLMRLVFPNLERFNWRSAPIYQTSVSANEVFQATGSALGWLLVLLSATVLIFRRRDFV